MLYNMCKVKRFVLTIYWRKIIIIIIKSVAKYWDKSNFRGYGNCPMAIGNFDCILHCTFIKNEIICILCVVSGQSNETITYGLVLLTS